ncbi:MAG: hypothetical protein NZ992_00095 [Candidatus Korarchaeum sp.]|nr:hypothetical protein [Candidatus Korarchaeum sp.]MDW8093367.1 hypothetical protein [Nitrososphaerota archaeon]
MELNVDEARSFVERALPSKEEKAWCRNLRTLALYIITHVKDEPRDVESIRDQIYDLGYSECVYERMKFIVYTYFKDVPGAELLRDIVRERKRISEQELRAISNLKKEQFTYALYRAVRLDPRIRRAYVSDEQGRYVKVVLYDGGD